MWLELVYKPTSLFSLKQSSATNSAAKTLLCPSPYAVKMALLNAIITYDSLEAAQKHFNLIKDLEMRFCLPKTISVNNCFLKIKKKKRSDSRGNEKGTFQSTVAFREYVYLDGYLKISVNLQENNNNGAETDLLKRWCPRINYFGKRGCFFQFLRFNPEEIHHLSKEYSKILNSENLDLDSPNIIFPMDDFGKKATFDKVNTYSSSKTDRESKMFLFPYYVSKSNKNFTIYKRYE